MGTKRARASSRREEILAATVGLVEEVGYEGVRVADVALKLGVSPSLVIYHFETKEKLVAKSFRFAMENDLITLQRIAKSERDPLLRVIAIMRWYAPSATSRSWNLWINSWSAGMRNEELARVLAEADREWKKIIVEAIELAVGKDVRAELNAWGSAVRMCAFVDGLAVATVARKIAITRETVETWVEEFVRYELRCSNP